MTFTHFIMYVGKQMLSDLPGVGHALNEKLMSFNMVTCEQLQSLSKSFLQQEFGKKLEKNCSSTVVVSTIES